MQLAAPKWRSVSLIINWAAESQLTTTSTRRQEQGIVLIGALRGSVGFDSWARSALVKWNVRLLVHNFRPGKDTC